MLKNTSSLHYRYMCTLLSPCMSYESKYCNFSHDQSSSVCKKQKRSFTPHSFRQKDTSPIFTIWCRILVRKTTSEKRATFCILELQSLKVVNTTGKPKHQTICSAIFCEVGSAVHHLKLKPFKSRLWRLIFSTLRPSFDSFFITLIFFSLWKHHKFPSRILP